MAETAETATTAGDTGADELDATTAADTADVDADVDAAGVGGTATDGAGNAATSAGANHVQTSEPYAMWNPEQWWDEARWILTGAEQDSDFKAGLWWQDSLDMAKQVPAMRQAADYWDKQIDVLNNAKDRVRAIRERIAGHSGEHSAAQETALDEIDKSINQKTAAIQPVGNALRNSASVIENGNPRIVELWNKWENDRANFEQCHADTVAMTPIITDMARSLLDASNAVQKAYETNLNMNTPGASTIAVNNLNRNANEALGSANTNDNATQVSGTNGAAGSTTGASTAGSNGDNATVTPAAAAAAGNTTGASSATGSGTASNFGATPGTVVSPGSSNASDNGVSLAGGAGTLAPPPSVTGGGLSGGSGLAAASGGGLGAGGLGGAGLGNTVPFTPGAVGGAGFAGGVGTFFGAGTAAPSRKAQPESGTGTGRGGAGAPLIGGATPGRADRRERRDVRPGYADRSRGAAGVAAGLLGRAAKDADFNAIGANSARRATRRRADAEDESLQVLDEDAWVTDDPGNGVIKTESRSRRDGGTPLLG